MAMVELGKMQYHKNNFLLFIVASFLLILTGCSFEKSHNIEYYGTFFYDTATVGAIRIEYDRNYNQSPVGIDSKRYNTKQWLDLYNISSLMVTKSILLGKNLDGPLNCDTKFVAPWLLYQISRKSECIEMMNLTTGKKWTILDHNEELVGISSNGNYAIVGNMIIRRDDGSIFQYFDDSNPIYFDEDSMMSIVKTGNTYTKNYWPTQKIDTMNIPDQGGLLRAVSSNTHFIVGATAISVYGESYITCGIVTLEKLLTENFVAEPLKCHVCNGEYLPEKDLYLATDGTSIFLGNIQETKFPTMPIKKSSSWSK